MTLILLTGTVLRFWDFWHLPFTFDELSAMSRTVYGSFEEMIRVGVVEKDSHPAGVQTFLYYWVRWFGEKEIVVKLPFLLAGILSVWLIYRIGALWFNRSTGILVAAFVSSLQLFVLYSQVARPYASGLLLTLAMVWFWSRFFFRGNKISDLLLFTVFGALSAYNHYISLLFVATVGLTGFLLTTRKTIGPYLLSGAIMILLYLPHFSIFLAQAEKGTIGGWLGAPGPWFIAAFFHWLFHYSFICYGAFLLILTAGLITGKKARQLEKSGMKRLILLLWLIPTPVFGYIYSYTKEPVLQFSLLIFTTPYFFILIFSFLREFSMKALAIATTLILVCNVATLIFVREHYRILYKQPFEEVVEKALDLNKEYPEEVIILNDYIPYYSEYYFRKYQASVPYFTIRNKGLSSREVDSIVAGFEQEIVITSGLPPDYFHLVQKHYPFWTGYDNGFTYEQYIFRKSLAGNSTPIKPRPITNIDFRQSPPGWSYDPGAVESDSLSSDFSYAMADREWGPLFRVSLDSLSASGYIFIDVIADVVTQSEFSQGIIVTEIIEAKEQIAWRGRHFSFTDKNDLFQTVFTTMDIQVMLGDKMHIGDKEARIYIWNPEKTDFHIRSISIFQRPANPYRYALFSNFKNTF